MTYDPRTPFSEPPPEALEPLYWEHERPARRKVRGTQVVGVAVICMVTALGMLAVLVLAWVASKW